LIHEEYILQGFALAGRRASRAYIHHIASNPYALKIPAKRPNTDLHR
jgi:hypothetical protein